MHRGISQREIDVEITTFSIFNKRCCFICISFWDSLGIQRKLPLSGWKEKIQAPKLRITGLMRAFSGSVSHLMISGSYSIDSESYSDLSTLTEELMEEHNELSNKSNDSKILWLIAALKCILSNICLTLPRSLYFIHLVFVLHHIWIGCFKKLFNCMVVHPFISSM